MRPKPGAEVHRIRIDREPPRAGLHRKKFGGRRSNGSLVLYDDASLAEARNFWMEGVLKCGKNNLNLNGTLGLRVLFIFPHPKCSFKKKAGKYELRGQSPDCSNLLKVCEDVLQEMGVVANDSMFASVNVTKLTGATPLALVEIMELEPSVEVGFGSR